MPEIAVDLEVAGVDPALAAVTTGTIASMKSG
jgi:hypothetical protein